MTESVHTDVGAYALGLLEEPDRRAFEEHLAGCGSCAAELAAFSNMGGLLTGIRDEESLPDEADFQQAGNVVDMVRRRASSERRRRRANRLFAAAAAVVLVAAGAIGGSALAGNGDNVSPDSQHKPAAALLLTGKRFSATDPTTGTKLVVALETRGWGTHVAYELRGVKGPLNCQLIAVSRTGKREVTSSWHVPPEGYGVPGQPDPMVLHGSTSISQADLDHFEIRTSAGKDLVNVPV